MECENKSLNLECWKKKNCSTACKDNKLHCRAKTNSCCTTRT